MRTKFDTLSSTTSTAASFGIDGFGNGWVSEGLVQLGICSPCKESLDLLRERIDVNGFLDVAVAACLQGALAVAAHDVGGDGHDGQLGKLRHGLDARGQGVSVDLGHVDVH